MRLLFLFIFIVGNLQISGAEEPVDPGLDGLFDFSEPEVTKEVEKKAKETVDRDDLKADGLLPENVRQMLDRLTVYELIENEILEKRIVPARATLKERLLSLSDKATAQEKLDLVGLAKFIEGMAASEPLRPEKIALSNDSAEDTGGWLHKGKPWTTMRADGTVSMGKGGTWRWLNKKHTIFVLGFPGNGHANVIFQNSPQALEALGINNLGVHYTLTRDTIPAGAARKPSANGLRLVAGAAVSEAALRVQTQNRISKRRAGVAAWLIEQAKTAKPSPATRILAEARRLGATSDALETQQQPGRFAGAWILENGNRLEFKPGGTVAYSKLGRVTWTVAKAHNWGSALILFGNTEDPDDAWIARVSTSSPGVLKIYTRDKSMTAKLEQP